MRGGVWGRRGARPAQLAVGDITKNIYSDDILTLVHIINCQPFDLLRLFGHSRVIFWISLFMSVFWLINVNLGDKSNFHETLQTSCCFLWKAPDRRPLSTARGKLKVVKGLKDWKKKYKCSNYQTPQCKEHLGPIPYQQPRSLS